MAKTPSKKSAKAAKVASTTDKKKKVKRSRVETYSSYLYKVRPPPAASRRARPPARPPPRAPLGRRHAQCRGPYVARRCVAPCCRLLSRLRAVGAGCPG